MEFMNREYIIHPVSGKANGIRESLVYPQTQCKWKDNVAKEGCLLIIICIPG